MADTTGNEFEADIQDLSGGGSQYKAKLPAYVLDKTLRDVMEGLVKAVSATGNENSKGLQELAEKYKEALEGQTAETTETIEDAEETTRQVIQTEEEKTRQKLEKVRQQEKSDRKKEIEKTAAAIQRGAEKGGRIGSDLLVSAVKGLAVVLGTAGGVLIGSFANLGNGLRTLTDQGQAFGDQLGVGTASTLDNIIAMNLMGITTEQSISILAEYSRAMSTMGQQTLMRLNHSFLEMTDNGLALGVALDEATEMFMQDQQFRARTLNKDRIDTSITAQLTMKSIQNLRGFSAILGQSTDALRQSSEGVMDGNKAFQAFTNSLDANSATNMNAVAKNLVEGLIAVFPQSGEDLGNALLSVAGTGVGAISDFANMLIPLGGSISTEFQGLARRLRDGSIGIDEVPQAIQGIVNAASLNQDQLEQLSVIAGLEGHPMQQVAETIITMQQEASVARDRLQKLADGTGMQFDEVQRTTVGFENIMKSVKGGYNALINSIPIETTKVLGKNFDGLISAFTGRGGISVLNTELQRAGREIGKAIGDTLNDLAPDGDYGKVIRNIIDKMIQVTKYLTEKVGNVIKALNNEGQLDIAGAIRTFIAETIGFLFTAIGEAFQYIPWGTVLKLGAVYVLFTTLTSAIGVAFAIAAMKAGTAFQMAAMRVSAMGGMGGMMGRVGKGVARVAAPVAALGGGLMLASDVAQGDSSGMKGGAIGAGLGLLLGAALAPFTGGLSLAAGLAYAGGGYAVGSMMTGDGGKKNKNRTPQPATVTSPNLAGPTTSSLSTNYLDQMTNPSNNPSNSTVMSAREINKLDRTSDETKALTLLLAENKRLNKQIAQMVDAGLKVKQA